MKTLRLFRGLWILPLLSGWVGPAHALVCTSAATGNWNAAATWAVGCGLTGPTALDTVTISTGHTVTATTRPSATTLTINAGGTLNAGANRIRISGATTVNGTLNLGTGAGSRFTGLVTLNAGGVWTATTATVNFRGGLTNNGGTFTAGTGLYTVTTAAQAFNGTAPIVIPNLTVTTVALTNNANLTVGTALAGTGSLVNGATGILNIGGTSAITALTATAVGNTVNYTGAAQTVQPTAYYNLGLSGSGAKTLTGVTTVAGNLVLSGAATAATTANMTIGGNLDVGVGTTFTSAFTNSVTGATTISGTLTSSAAAAQTYIGAVTVNAGGAWSNTGNAPVTFQNGLTFNGGTFTAGTGIYTFSTTAAQTVSCATALAIPSMTVTAPTVLTNACPSLTIATALTGTGNLTNGAGSTLNLGGTSTVTTLNATTVGNSVNYTGAAQTVQPTAYYNLGLSGSGAKTMTGVTTIGGNLSISGTVTMTGNAAFTVTGALSYASTGATTLTAATPISIGSFNQTAGTLVDNGNTITVTGTGAGTWAQTAGTFTPTGTVVFTGAAPQIGTANFNNLTINVGAGNSATLNGNATLSGVLTMSSGRLSTGANTLDVGASCVGVTGSSTSYVLGNVRLHYPTLNPGTTTCTFPIGDANAYTPVTVALSNVTSTLANSTLTASTTAGDHADTTAGTSGVNGSRSVNRYWTLTPGALLTFATYTTTFNFVAGDIDAGATTANFKIGRKSGGVWSYPAMGAANPLNTTATGMTQAGGFGEFAIGERYPTFTLTKLVDVFWDPLNQSVNPKFIPGALAQYTIIVINAAGPADNNSVVITDAVPANAALYVGDINGAGSGPVVFTQGATSSTLTYTFTALGDMADDVSFSKDSGATWTAVPVAGADGCDPTITHIRINPKGTFVGNATPPSPSFSLSFRACVR
jgi:hypothetical protein